MLTIYKASAGSGKTYRLTLEYLKALLTVKQPDGTYVLNSEKRLKGPRRQRRHRVIMAITFTNAATAEMKERIIGTLNDIACGHSDADSIADSLCRVAACTREELREVADRALGELLYDFGGFNVSTIDSFFQTVLRTFAREIDRQGDYEVELNTRDVISRSISQMLDDFNYNSPSYAGRLQQWLVDRTLNLVKEGQGYNYFDRSGKLLSDLTRNMEKCLDEHYAAIAKPLRDYLFDASRPEAFVKLLKEIIAGYRKPYVDAAQAVVDFARLHAMSERGSVYPRAEKVARGGRLVSSDLSTKAFTEDPSELTDRQLIGKKTPELSAGAREEYTELCRRFVEEHHRARPQIEIYTCLLESVGQLEFIGMVQETMQTLLRDNNIMLIGDTGELLSRIIGVADTPFVYERLGMLLENIMIDEFQDTSPMQWRNLKPLVANGIDDYDNLIIGDEKQAIYRFRNSDSALLGHVVQDIDFPGKNELRGTVPEENTNYRSAPEIVRFNNTLFSLLSRSFDTPYYSNVVQRVAKEDMPGYVRLTLLPDKFDRTEVLERMAQDILRQHADGYGWRRILILARSNTDIREIVRFMVERHPEIPVLSSEALLLSNSPAVRTIISLLNLVGRSYHAKALTRDGDDGARRYSSRSDVALLITRYNYFANTLDGEGADALEAALRDTGDHNDALLDEIRAIRAKNPSNIVALIDAVAQTKLPPEQRRNEYAYIAALQDQALRMADSTDSSLASFLDAYERNVNVWAIQAAADIDAVEAMTIHRSKGLGRDCVIIPFGDWELEHGNTRMWLPLDAFAPLRGKDCVPPALYVDVPNTSPLADAEQSPVAPLVTAEIEAERIDNLNATYVAYTRAKHELIVYMGCREVGAEIARCLQSDTVPAPDTISLAEHYDPATAEFTLGAPTKASAAKAPDPAIDAGEYHVIFRDDTRELVCIDDLLAADVDIGNEQPAEVVDPRAPFTSTPEMDEAARRGTVLHSVLANTLVIDDLEEALRWNAARENIGEAELDTFRRDLAAAFAAGGDEVVGWFADGNEVLVERTIYAPAVRPDEPDRSLRPDRVVIAPDGTVTVVDYKFTTEVKNSHRRQVSEYISLMHSLGYERVGGRLWYPLLHKVIRVE